MGLILKYVKRTSSGGFEYRRRVPMDILGLIPKREFKQVLRGNRKGSPEPIPSDS